ncbi:MAG: electron transporter RnfD [Deltaproteobacteria bacterium]|nr:MAG: electron transporter RnfD [Deltaproteobacteria bacterium]
MSRTFFITSSPHVNDGDSIFRIMWSVVGALLPATLWGFYLFGMPAVRVTLFTVAAAVLAEAAANKMRGRADTTLDGSAVLTGLLLALNLPPSAPWWLCVFGGAAAILLGKQVFGGLGHNPFNPALVARVLLLVSFPAFMTDWAVDAGYLADAVSSATVLGEAKTFLMTPALGALPDVDYLDLFIGFRAGCIGEVSPLLLLAGAAYLYWRRIITIDIPLAFIATVFVITTAAWGFAPEKYLNPMAHLMTGGLMIGALFMATDMVTSPLNTKGRWIFGLGCGLLTAVIRLWGGYPEGVSFSILLMNACVPLIDRYTKPRKFGLAAPAKGGG